MSSGRPVIAYDEGNDNNDTPSQIQDRAGTPNLIARSQPASSAARVGPEDAHSTPITPAVGSHAPSSFGLTPGTDDYEVSGYTTQTQRQSHQGYEHQTYASPQELHTWQQGQRFEPHVDFTGPHGHQLNHQPAYGYAQAPYQYDDPRNQYYRDQTYLAHAHAQQPYPAPYGNFAQASMQGPQQHLPAFTPRPPMTYAQSQVAYAQLPNLLQASRLAGQGPYVGQHGAHILPNRPSLNHGFSARLQGASPASPTQSERTPSYPRGPPRKPKQSGFAVWVGNLSPGTTIEQLKDYFSKGATKHIESVFLISKSNCAFVNYRTPESAQAAVARFHDSRLNGVRLVCRLRHGQAATTADTPTAYSPEAEKVNSATPAAAIGPNTALPEESPERNVEPSVKLDSTNSASAVDTPSEAERPDKQRVPEKFFIVKSLTLQDLEASVRDGIWATQAHNEASLNEAFESAHTVYLIFSANKSGEYFGYARMRSKTGLESNASNSRAERAAAGADPGPTSTPTPATDSAPPGRIVDDSARGTIFWEADSSSGSDDDDGEDIVDGSTRQKSAVKADKRRNKLLEEAEDQDWGKPFQIEWISTTRLPFYRTRGLRNPWNANREIKIARDGTELEPSVGRRLLDMFHEPVPHSNNSTSISYQSPFGPVIAMGSAHSFQGQTGQQ